MAIKQDLTFDEMNTALGGSAISVSGTDVLISVSAITGDAYSALTDEGVIEFLYKFRSACTSAQEVANATLADGEKLDSFPGFSFSPPNNNEVRVTQSHIFKIPLDTSTVTGTNV